MTKFKLVCNGFWPDGELDNGQKFFDANFDIVNVETGETVGETGRTGWDEANLRALDGAPCTEEGDVLSNIKPPIKVK